MDLFTDFLLSTGASDLGGPQGITNLLTRRGYLLKALLRGGPGFKTLQGGSSIRGDVMIRDVSTARNYKPNEKQSWPNPQVLDSWGIPWRFTVDHMTWNDQEVELNASANMSEDAQAQAFVDMRKKIKMRCVTSLAHFLEDQLFAKPVYSDMELTSGRVPNSLALFSNELQNTAGTNNGLYYTYRTAGGGNNEVMGLNKTTYSAWDNARASYSSIGTSAAGHLFSAFDDVILETGIQQLPGPDGGMASDPMSSLNLCVTGKAGFKNFQHSLRINQDWFRMGEQNPAYPGPNFDGITLMYLPSLDTATIYPTAQAAAIGAETDYGTWDDTSNTTVPNLGPRYHLFDFSVLHKGFHSARYFKMLKEKSPSNQVTDHVIPVDNWHNNFCRDLRKQGCIYPSVDITSV